MTHLRQASDEIKKILRQSEEFLKIEPLTHI